MSDRELHWSMYFGVGVALNIASSFFFLKNIYILTYKHFTFIVSLWCFSNFHILIDFYRGISILNISPSYFIFNEEESPVVYKEI